MPQANSNINSIDTLSSRLDMALSLLVCLSNTYEGEENGFSVPHYHAYNVVWGAVECLQLAQAAFCNLLDRQDPSVCPVRCA